MIKVDADRAVWSEMRQSFYSFRAKADENVVKQQEGPYFASAGKFFEKNLNPTLTIGNADANIWL